MDIIIQPILNNPYIKNKYLLFLVTLLILYLLSKFLVYIAKKFFLRLAKRTKTKADDLIVERTSSPMVSLVVTFGLKIAINILQFPESINKFSNHIFDTFIIIYITVIIVRVIDVLIDEWGKLFAKKTKSTIDDELLPLFHRTSKIIFVILSIIFILRRWEVDVSGLLAGVGIAGIAISFALKDSLSNIFGGISIIFDKTYKMGDIVRLEGGESGKILNIGLRSTRIRSWDGEVLIIPNSIMANTKLTNVMQPDLAVRI